ncbi:MULTISPECIES: 5-bromo-4-chloroindolyl phosphate hydrolysis family protein [unclassified Clostridioides]|uniref:5-bromo-4-chloroindolyl phosphate hydrolysis family protein n=1 Tax=unclassified Clostridioides TaxID=2635829 RepID=UPI001D125AF2|nr:5-bromo-4-chloroindolyl phosphate hydrolysis family protein [Clostridioides sp. ZZV15-6388]MCC0642771.1 5-bromo-4-chloroindolyl phosphate hydrolysis family protein [Clostridioides sp. ZZV14-6150]MCC0660281.1 5-bromo-4-chloroindolyl phosphate hydrolysis family protein [Clostridioides sp. ZZV14-6154]MCC0663274.1 5-bromo-4-chloroindolyl phosphate hydrolysis family protein [Clostridioides sp. ZZV15-6597]MCC0667467.1 5-bromo-4-chloroindolyl phosphate hydrolysis family protein [Clostridioides sp. 
MYKPENFSKKSVLINSFLSKFLKIVGWGLVGLFTLSALVLSTISIIIGWAVILPIQVCALFLIIGGVCIFKGKRLGDQISRYKKYCTIISNKNIIPVELIAESTSKSLKFIIKDVQKMIDKNYFINTYIDKRNNQIVLTNEDGIPPVYEDVVCEVEEDEVENSNEVDMIIKKGMDYLRQIKEANENIKSESMCSKIVQVEDVTSKIFDVVKHDPSKLTQIQKFMDYYIPTTLKLLNSYHTLEEQGIDRENITTTMESIESTMSTIVVAFENQLDSLFEDEAIDISTDITVLENMLVQEGLTGGKF